MSTREGQNQIPKATFDFRNTCIPHAHMLSCKYSKISWA